MSISLHTTEYNVIYVLSKADIDNALKIGKTTVRAYDVKNLTPNCEALIKATEERIKGLATYGVTDIKIEYTEVAWFEDSEGKKSFWDTDVHSVLMNSHYKKKIIPSSIGSAEEWFEVDLETAKKAIAAVKENKETIEGPPQKKKERKKIVFRQEQEKAIADTQTHYAIGKKMLWNAKMRFGKTLCALELIKRMDFKKTLILTHRPTVRKGWFEDYHNIQFNNFAYGSKNGVKYATLDEDDFVGKNFEQLVKDQRENDTRFIYFASMQDLRGSDSISDKGIKKNHEVFKTDWDLIILDEAHEGTQTTLGKNVINGLSNNRDPYFLYLSGTPYNILSLFDEDEVYTWDYVMEQAAKENWEHDHPNEPNPYGGLAKMSIYTYDIADAFENEGYNSSDEDYFNFTEFFRVWKGDVKEDKQEMPQGAKIGTFVHEADVVKFLDLLCNEQPVSYYPFSNEEFRNALSHTLWMLPGTSQAEALCTLLEKHKLHTELGYHIVNVAGEGKKIESSDPDDKLIEQLAKDALDKVLLAIRGKAEKNLRGHNRTITLSCGRLTTGVSVPEWTGVFMLSGGYNTAAANYMQTIFRSQTPYKNGAIKTDCYAFDFAPDRTLTVIDDWVAMRPRNGNGQHNQSPHTVKIESLLRFCPVISMEGGVEKPYDAVKFVTKVNNAYSDNIIRNGFKGARLVKNYAEFTEQDYLLLENIGKLIKGDSGVQTNANGEIVISKNNLKGEKWTCVVCGAKDQTEAKCSKCGADRPPKSTSKTTWTCGACGHEGNEGDFCDVCGESFKKKSQKKGWTCPNCGHQGNTSSECEECGAQKPKRQQSDSDRRKKAQSVLDQIFVRIPLLLFGAVEDANSLTIDELVSNRVIDDESWEEFMPSGFKKSMLKQIEHLIRIDRLVASASKTIEEAKSADYLSVEDRVLKIASMISRFRYPDKETVLTPWRIVNLHMSDTIGGFDFYDEKHQLVCNTPRFVNRETITDFVFNKESKILEINSKSGVYPLYVTYSLYRVICEAEGKALSDDEKERIWEQILKENVFVLCKTSMAKKITHRVLAGYKDIKTNCMTYPNLLGVIKNKPNSQEMKEFLDEIRTDSFWETNNLFKKDMKFNAAVGNPPYQKEVARRETSNGQKRRQNIFQYFQIACDKLATYTSLIYPGGRWIHQSGKGLKDFGHDQINSEHLLLLEFFPEAKDIFENVDIADGISIVLKDCSKQKEGFIYRYITNDLTIELELNKPGDDLMPLVPFQIKLVEYIKKIVKNRKFKFLDSSVLSQKLFSIESDFVENNPTKVREYQEGDAFNPDTEVKLFTNDKAGKSGRAKWFVVAKSEIKTGREYLDKWKVIVSSANAGGQKRNNQIEIVDNHSAFGRARVALKTFDSEEEAKNFLKYVESELIRFTFWMTDESLTSLAKYVPDIQNYKADNGIIDFAQDINEQLYKLFEIDENDQKLIQEFLNSKEHRLVENGK